MDQTALVDPDVDGGKTLFKELESSLRIEAAFWWKEDDNWKLILATPLVYEQGPISVYSRIREIIVSEKPVDRKLFEKIRVVSPSAGVVTLLAFAGEGPLPRGRLIQSESVRGIYVEGAYFYKFEPKTFAKAS